ncbi:IS30 family transposase [Erysipelothrix rhusiopathiae]|nr:IS30 family transposase [Erysipelothrix rhusiopathiae]MDE8084938.1 IS30 family transposase [Erysipelothrix rhusiopathiae]MDE8098551.1 IS30 family transposase [Erysipelothrix rhusiopathiae]MDE8109028.1 IS30 family transposase [Erysipelothrix rhusiopathiae]MDE8145552.1 IS30 family transposase [Erysipelothrix rhusiopathiae]
MKYKQLDKKMKDQIDILLSIGFSMRKAARKLNISHSTISRYKNNVYKKRTIDIREKYSHLIEYLHSHYDHKVHSVEVCLSNYKRYHPYKPCVSSQQIYNWINQGKLDIKPNRMCYKRRKRKKRISGMMNHLRWNLEEKTVLPISLRPKYIEKRNEIGHLEIDSIIGKKHESAAIISIVDRCSRMTWLIKAEYRYDYYTSNLIRKFIEENNITTKSITVDNGLEFKTLGITAKRLGVKLYKCDPYCSFQRGTNERANAIVRRFIPKGKSMYDIAQQYLDDICFKINSMPRKIFDFKTAYEIDFNKSKSGAVEI